MTGVGRNRCKGQKSNSKSTNGKVTSIGLLIRPRVKKSSASRYQAEAGIGVKREA